jgi:succinyl-diaminopimelate desuccinylase
MGPKQAWTPVAEFAVAGVDAVNFGPGNPRYAHTDDERVEVDALVRGHDVLSAFLSGTASTRGG